MNVVHHCTQEKHNSSSIGITSRYCFSWIMRVGILTALVLGFFYVMLLNSLATQGFALEEMKVERLQIQKEVEKWDIALAIPTSLYALQSSEQVQMMDDVDKKHYIAVKAGEVAFQD